MATDKDRPRVLVVDDNLPVAATLEALLEDRGYVCVGLVSSASKILPAVRRHAPAAVLLDVNLRGELVYPYAQKLLAAGIPFLFLSAYQKLPHCPPELSSIPRLVKPCTAEELDHALDQLLWPGHGRYLRRGR